MDYIDVYKAIQSPHTKKIMVWVTVTEQEGNWLTITRALELIVVFSKDHDAKFKAHLQDNFLFIG